MSAAREQLEMLWANVSDPSNTELYDDMRTLCSTLWTDGQREAAIQVGLDLVDRLDADSNPSEFADSVYQVAWRMASAMRHAEAFELVTDALAKVELMANDFDVAFLYWLKADIHGRRDEFMEQADCYTQARMLVDNDDSMSGDLFVLLASAQVDLEFNELAKENLRFAIDRFQKCADASRVARAQFRIAEIELELHNGRDALDLIQRARSVFEFKNEQSSVSECLMLEGEIYADLGQAESAIDLFANLYSSRVEIGVDWIPAQARLKWGELLLKLGRIDEGTEMIRAIEPVLTALGQEQLAAEANSFLGNESSRGSREFSE